MKKQILFIPIAALVACSPALQSNIFTHSAPDMEKVESECANTTAHEKNIHVAAVNCRFDAYEVILGEKGFQEYNDLDTLKKHFLSIAKQQDAHKLTDDKALGLFEKYTQEFYSNLQQHDKIKYRAYEIQKQQTMAVIGAVASGLGAGLQVMGNAYQARADAYGNAAAAYQPPPQYQHLPQQQQIQQQQYEINTQRPPTPAEKLRDCIQEGNCPAAFAPPYPKDSYGSYGSVPNMQ